MIGLHSNCGNRMRIGDKGHGVVTERRIHCLTYSLRNLWHFLVSSKFLSLITCLVAFDCITFESIIWRQSRILSSFLRDMKENGVWIMVTKSRWTWFYHPRPRAISQLGVEVLQNRKYWCQMSGLQSSSVKQSFPEDGIKSAQRQEDILCAYFSVWCNR